MAAVVEVEAHDKAKVGKELESAIDRGEADSGVLGAHALVHLDRGEMVRTVVQGKQHGKTLPGRFQTMPMQLVFETALQGRRQTALCCRHGSSNKESK